MRADYRLHLPPQHVDAAEGETRRVLDKAREAVGFVPNMYANMVNAPELLETYLDGYGRFRSGSGFGPAEQEVVFLAISRFNGCDYCVSAHSMLAAKVAKLEETTLEALRSGQALPDAKLDALANFTETMVRTRGLPSREAVERFLAAGYGERHVLDIVLALAVKTLSNYSNHLFATELDPVFQDYAWQAPDRRDAA